MKNKMKIIGIAAFVLAVVLTVQTSRAGFGGYSSWTITTAQTNTPIASGQTNFVYIQLPAIAFTATATNNVTITTNNIVQTLTNAFGTFSLTMSSQFIYNSGTYGTNFSTNFPPQSYVLPVITVFEVRPQTIASNIVQESVN